MPINKREPLPVELPFTRSTYVFDPAKPFSWHNLPPNPTLMEALQANRNDGVTHQYVVIPFKESYGTLSVSLEVLIAFVKENDFANIRKHQPAPIKVKPKPTGKQ